MSKKLWYVLAVGVLVALASWIVPPPPLPSPVAAAKIDPDVECRKQCEEGRDPLDTHEVCFQSKTACCQHDTKTCQPIGTCTEPSKQQMCKAACEYHWTMPTYCSTPEAPGYCDDSKRVCKNTEGEHTCVVECEGESKWMGVLDKWDCGRITYHEVVDCEDQGDTDCDGWQNCLDICPSVPDPTQGDEDCDHVGDVCDAKPTHFDP